MSSISNRFYVTALQDGTTLHGNLVADNALSQSWNGSSAIPNWAVTTQPTVGIAPYGEPVIHLTLLSGATAISNDLIGNQRWFYNGVEIEFMNTTSTLTVYTEPNPSTATTTITGYWSKTNNSPDYRFFKQIVTINGVECPALRITSNLAAGENLDIDTITFSGEYIIDTASVGFSCTAQVKIASVAKTGYLGVINFQNGISDITYDGQEITMQGVLYDGSNGQVVNTYSTLWFLNDAVSGKSGGSANTFTVDEDDVVDHATVRCEFYSGEQLLGTAYAGIDDMQDPQFMYIQYGGNNGNSASLRKGEYAQFKIWVGRREDPTVDRSYNHFKLMLLDGNGVPMGGDQDTTTDPTERINRAASKAGINTDPNNPEGWIPACMTVDGVVKSWRNLDPTIDANGKATINVHYNTVNGYGKNVTGIILAETSA